MNFLQLRVAMVSNDTPGDMSVLYKKYFDGKMSFGYVK